MKDEKKETLKEINELLLKAEYRKAASKAKTLRIKFKHDFDVNYIYAKALGDYADELPKSKSRPLKKRSCLILKNLVHRLNGQAEQVRFGVRVNYCYQSGEFSRLEKIGNKLIRKSRTRGLYAAGAGASLGAEQAFRLQQDIKAKNAAARSLKYWNRYLSIKKEVYYFPYTLIAMSAAILQDRERMEISLKIAERISGKGRNYWEFRSVRKIFSAAKSRRT